MVVSSAPASTTNITGFLTMVRGFNFRKDSKTAVRRILVSVSEIALCCGWSAMSSSESLSGMHQQVLENRTQAERREKCERAHNQNGGNEQSCEQRASNGERPCRRRSNLFLRQVAGNGKHRNRHEESAQQHGRRAAGVVPQGVSIKTAERRAVVADRRRVDVQHL